MRRLRCLLHGWHRPVDVVEFPNLRLNVVRCACGARREVVQPRPYRARPA